MMEVPKRNMKTQIDWIALEMSWAEQYEEDYGNLFFQHELKQPQDQHIGFKC